jgi:CHAT domain-containing protein
MLVAPLEGQIKTSHVAVVPHQALHTVPFAALTDGERYFGAEHVLTMLPSASALRFLRVNAKQSGESGDAQPPALVYGDPLVDIPGLPQLPAAKAEALAVADLLQTAAYTGKAASEVRLREVLSGTSILHLAAHGSYDPSDPLASLIALSPGGGEDGRLEAREIFGLPLRGSELVVLSACQSNVGELSGGDEVVGLTRAFFFAGAPSVLSSLWSVDDAATSVLMTSFYRHWLQEGLSKAQALQAAQADVRADPKWASPFYWAAFTLNGDEG